MSRSIKKGSLVHAGLLKRIEEMNQSRDREVIKTWSRSSTVFSQMIGHIVAVHDGKKHIPVCVTEDVVGHKLGEFALARTFKGHIKDEKTSKRK